VKSVDLLVVRVRYVVMLPSWKRFRWDRVSSAGARVSEALRARDARIRVGCTSRLVILFNIPPVDVTVAYIFPNFNYNFDEFSTRVEMSDEKSIVLYLLGWINQIIGAMKFGTCIKLTVENYKKQMKKGGCNT
jgi:hypothetical protein